MKVQKFICETPVKIIPSSGDAESQQSLFQSARQVGLNSSCRCHVVFLGCLKKTSSARRREETDHAEAESL